MQGPRISGGNGSYEKATSVRIARSQPLISEMSSQRRSLPDISQLSTESHPVVSPMLIRGRSLPGISKSAPGCQPFVSGMFSQRVSSRSTSHHKIPKSVSQILNQSMEYLSQHDLLDSSSESQPLAGMTNGINGHCDIRWFSQMSIENGGDRQGDESQIQGSVPSGLSAVSEISDGRQMRVSVTKLDLVWLLISVLTYLADLGSDIWVALLHKKKKDRTWMILTIVCILAPCLVMNIGLCLMKMRCRRRLFYIIVSIPGGLTFLYIRDIISGWKAFRNHGYIGKHIDNLSDSFYLRLLDSFVEAAPQLVLQLYVIFKTPEKTVAPVQLITVTLSLVSLSWAMVAFYKTFRLSSDTETYKVNIPGMLSCFCWHFFTIGARVLAYAICATYNAFALLGVAVAHVVILILFYSCLHHSQGHVKNVCTFIFRDALFNWFILLFCSQSLFFDLSKTRLHYIFIHILTFLENIVMLLLWYFSTRSTIAPFWLVPCVFCAIIGGYLIGILSQILYYMRFHPKNYI